MGTKPGERGVMRTVSRREGEQGEHRCETKEDEDRTSRPNIAGERTRTSSAVLGHDSYGGGGSVV